VELTLHYTTLVIRCGHRRYDCDGGIKTTENQTHIILHARNLKKFKFTMSHPIVKTLFALKLQSKCTYEFFTELLYRTTSSVFKRKEVDNQQIVSGL